MIFPKLAHLRTVSVPLLTLALSACTPQGDPSIAGAPFRDDFSRSELGPLWNNTGGAWRIADKRCGRDFSNREVASNYPGYWDEPQASDAGQAVDDWFGEDRE